MGVGIIRFFEIILANVIATLYPASKMIIQGTVDTMKYRAGHNREAGRDTFWLQLTDKKTLRSMRIFMEPHEFEFFAKYMIKLHGSEN